MARPQKQGMDYFPHDTDASNDEKIEVFEALYGNDGYAFFFKLCERIYRTPGARLDISQPETIIVLSKRVGVRPDKFKRMLRKALELGLFSKELAKFDEELERFDGELTSNGILRRAKVVLRQRSNQSQNNNNNPADNPVDNPADKGGKVNKTKQNKIKVNNILYPPLSPEMILSQKLKTGILKNNPNARTPESLQKWCAEFNALLHKNGYTQEVVEAVIDFSQSSDFWKSNILSAGKLREKFDTLYLQSKENSFGQKKGNGNGEIGLQPGAGNGTGQPPKKNYREGLGGPRAVIHRPTVK